MYSIRTGSLGLRGSAPAQVWTGRSIQRRWARVQDVRFVATQGEYNPVIEKYRAKLDKKARECVTEVLSIGSLIAGFVAQMLI